MVLLASRVLNWFPSASLTGHQWSARSPAATCSWESIWTAETEDELLPHSCNNLVHLPGKHGRITASQLMYVGRKWVGISGTVFPMDPTNETPQDVWYFEKGNKSEAGKICTYITNYTAKLPTEANWITPRKINMEPENIPLEEENHLPNHHFQVPAPAAPTPIPCERPNLGNVLLRIAIQGSWSPNARPKCQNASWATWILKKLR